MKKITTKKILSIKISVAALLLAVSAGIIVYDGSVAAQYAFASRLKGKILLQVEDHGEAWYVEPYTLQRYYLGRPADAFGLMQSLGMGITNEDLEKIPVAEANFAGTDSDDDGLPDALEGALGTDKNNPDTDGDGYNDKDEIINGYNPLGEGTINTDAAKTETLAGKILIQTEKNGEAWYVNPDNLERYYLGRPADAFNLMRSLGLGITNTDLAKIETYRVNQTYQGENIVAKYTTPVTNNSNTSASVRQYTDPSSAFKVDYPAGWYIKKYDESPNLTMITNAKVDFINEKKGVVTINYIESSAPIDDVGTFDIALAQKDSSVNISGENTKVKNYDAYENEYQNEVAYEKITTIKLSPTRFLQISLTTAKTNNSYYLGIYNNLLSSIELTN